MIARVISPEVVDDTLAFIEAFGGMEEGFRERAKAVDALLADDTTAFVLVTAPQGEAVDESCYFASQLRDSELEVAAVVVNRLQPRFTDATVAEIVAAHHASAAGTTAAPQLALLADLARLADAEDRPSSPPSWTRARARRWRASLSSMPTSTTSAGIHRDRHPDSRTEWELGDQSSSTRVEGFDGFVDGFGDRHDPVETGGVEQPGERGPTARDDDLVLVLAGSTNTADEGTEPGRVHERYVGQLDQEPGLVGQAGEGLAELPDGVGVELTLGAAQHIRLASVGGDVVDVDLQHGNLQRGRRRWIGAAALIPAGRGSIPVGPASSPAGPRPAERTTR